MSIKHGGLTILCNGCGNAMRDLGEWPVIWPKTEGGIGHKNVQQASRYACQTCKIPTDDFAGGLPVMATIIETDLT